MGEEMTRDIDSASKTDKPHAVITKTKYGEEMMDRIFGEENRALSIPSTHAVTTSDPSGVVKSMIRSVLRSLCDHSDPRVLKSNHHGLDHYLSVAHRGSLAVQKEPTLSSLYKTAVVVACLLHDVDDPKVVQKHRDPAFNAKAILKLAFEPGDVERVDGFPTIAQNEWEFTVKVLEMISLVSYSKNGMSFHPRYANERSIYIPRDCDRLEAVGQVGVDRCIRYANEKGIPSHTADTLRYYTLEDLDAFIKIKRPALPENCGMNHFYDKLLHICDGTRSLHSNNSYILEEAERGHAFIKNYVVVFWRQENDYENSVRKEKEYGKIL